ncbi:hypothetical protein NAS141_01321 [Sulfitobacter sp. NAS-14.1]|nr:hypothetical protein NAS141_01321 [Sulfitobacter sp. NAS-14.1]
MTAFFVASPPTSADVPVGGDGSMFRKNTRAAPEGSLFSCDMRASHHPR